MINYINCFSKTTKKTNKRKYDETACGFYDIEGINCSVFPQLSIISEITDSNNYECSIDQYQYIIFPQFLEHCLTRKSKTR